MEENNQTPIENVTVPAEDANVVNAQVEHTPEDYRKVGVFLNEPVTKKEQFFYGLGAFFDGGGASIAAVIMLAFFDRGLELGAFAAGLIILLAKLWDAVSDPLCGVISDNLRTRIGRRRPFFILGGSLLIPAFAFVFAPIGGWAYAVKLVAAIAAYLFYCTVSTISQVPYMSFASEISADFNERDKANTVKLLFTMTGAAISYLVPTVFLEKFLDGTISAVAFWAIMTFGFGIFFGLPLILAGVFCREKAPFNLDAKAKFSFKNYLHTMQVKSFRYHIGMYISAFMCMDIISALVIYYVKYSLEGMVVSINIGSLHINGAMSSAYIIGPMMVMVACMVPVVYKFMRTRSKQFAFRTFLPLYIVGGVVLCCIPPSTPFWVVIIFGMIMGMGFCGAQIMPWIIFPDTVDVAELKYGDREAGTFSGVMTFARKLASAIAVFVCSLILAASADGEKNFASFITGLDAVTGAQLTYGDTSKIVIRVLMGVAVVVLIGLAIFFSLRYKVTAAKLERIKYINDKIRLEGEESLTEEEAEEKAELLKELA